MNLLKGLVGAFSIGATIPSTIAAQSAPSNRRVQSPAADSVRAIAAPRTPFPSEAASAGVTRFSFIDYGDTRGRFDGQLEQQLHLLVVTSMLRTIAARANGPDPIRFVVSGGDAVADGRSAPQWNTSFVDVMDRLTQQGDVPVFPAPGNHDATHTMDRDAPDRQQALRHFLAAYRNFIPPETSPRRLAALLNWRLATGRRPTIAAIACWLPASRAARIEPSITLRAD